MNLIFLDIDGVLNSVDSAVAYHNWLPKGTRAQMEDRLDPVAVGLLRRLCIEADAKIVVSSTWRMGRTGENFIEIFRRHGWDDFPYLDKTPVRHTERGYEIQEWLDAHPEVTNYVILDDDSDMLDSQLHNFIHVSNVNGFRLKHYCKCLRLFGQPDERLEKQVNFVRQTCKGVQYV